MFIHLSSTCPLKKPATPIVTFSSEHLSIVCDYLCYDDSRFASKLRVSVIRGARVSVIRGARVSVIRGAFYTLEQELRLV